MGSLSDFLPGSSGLVFLASADYAGDAVGDFTAFDATKYDAYEFVLQNIIPATDTSTLVYRTSGDGGITFDNGASDYEYVILEWDFTTGVTDNGGSFARIARFLRNSPGESGVTGTFSIQGPHLSVKTHTAFTGSYTNDDNLFTGVTSVGQRLSATEVNAIRFFFDSGNIASGTIKMYGRVNA